MYRLVKDGEIERLARGVFIRPDYAKKLPTLAQLTKAKAKSFGRKIVTYGKEAAKKLALVPEETHSMTSLSNGSSSSFRSYAHGRYYAHATSPRKMNVGNGIAGKVIKALWYLGDEFIEIDLVKDAIAHLKDADWRELYAIWHYMPYWMTDRILWLFSRKCPNSQV
jgi:hypothetical protein